jgi:hypothetical protein
MTEEEWLVATDPTQMMIDVVWPGRAERKTRLFSCACCHRIRDHLRDERSWSAVLAAEQFADGLVSPQELEWAANAVDIVMEDSTGWDINGDRLLPWSAAAYNAAVPMGWWGAAPLFQPPHQIILDASSNRADAAKEQCRLLRDIFGNPFQPVAFDPSWLPSVVAPRLFGSR